MAESRGFLDGLRSHYWLDGGRLVVAHAGLKAEMHGRGSAAVRAFALYGETTGETDAFDLPVRYEWARDYRGKAMVVYGHTPVPRPNGSTAPCASTPAARARGSLTALRYPERELVSVPADRTYAEPVRRPPPAQAPPDAYDLLDIEDVSGKRIITIALLPEVLLTHILSALESPQGGDNRGHPTLYRHGGKAAVQSMGLRR